MNYINLNGKIIPESEALIPATSRAVFYGDGCFETFRSYKGKFLHFGDHFERLKAGLNYLEMKSDLSEDELKNEILKLLKKNDLEDRDSVVRVQCFRLGKSGYFDISDQSGFVISNREVKNRTTELSLKTVSVRAIPSVALERKVKLSNSINYIKAAQKAQKENCDDALMLTLDGFISETTIANIFWIKGNQVFTPSIGCDLLPGVTRSIIIDIINEKSDLTIEKGKFDLEEIYKADSVFCCNSVMELKLVSRIDNYSYNTDHSVFEKVKDYFKVYKEKSLK